MLFRILKKDLIRRKGVNFILFVFIALSTVFLSSSVNNILVITKAIDYCLDYANVPDATILVKGEDENERIESFMSEEKDLIKEYEYNQFLALQNNKIQIVKDGRKQKFNANSTDMYMADMAAKYNQVFDLEGNTITLTEGEVALTDHVMERNGLKEGDRIVIEALDKKKEFTVMRPIKDVAFGNEMVGMGRIIISEEDFDLFRENADILGQYYVDTYNTNLLNDKITEQNFTTLVNSITRDTYKLMYSFDMIMAALLIFIGICLILIALLVLRFTLVFTMEEAYQEIGIMKAVGIRELSIKKIYLIKYLFLVSLGAALGLALSFPVSTAMVAGVSENMFMEDSSANLWWNVMCAAAVILLVLLFCFGCTRKLNKISAITAIRGGETGERYVKRRGICLSSKKRMAVPLYLGINDISGHMKRYLLLIITFSISFILITIPLNTLNTMESDEMVQRFYIDPESAVYVRKLEGEKDEKYNTREKLEEGLRKVEKEMRAKGYDAGLTAAGIYFMKYSHGDKGENNIMTTQLIGSNTDYGQYEEGSAPRLANEVAFSKQIMEDNGWEIGDTVEAMAAGEKKSFIITGSYSDYLQIGNSARLNPRIDLKEDWLFDYWNVMVDMETDLTQTELAALMKTEFPDYEWSDAQSFVDRNVGGIKQSLGSLVNPMTGMLCLVVMLITILMEKLFVVREKGEIAMMKSVGFRNDTIKSWQIIRMVCVVAVSMIAAIPLSLVSNYWILRPIFAIMGADVKIQVVPWQVYGVYPGILLAGIILATVFAAGGVRKINIRELNNLE